jgi:hypothetical protein
VSVTAPVIQNDKPKYVLPGIDSIQPLPHRQWFTNDCGEFQLVVDCPGRAEHNRLWFIGGCPSGLVAVLAHRPFHVCARHDHGTGPPLVCDGKVEESWRRAGVVNNDAAGILDVFQ